MDQILRPGQAVRCEPSEMECVADELLGAGGQGEVYRATLGGEAVAVKWFFPHMSTPEQRAAIELLVRKGPPSEHFLWPLEVTTAPGVAGFGYVMPLRPKRFKNIVDLMKRRIEPTFRALATAGLNLSHNYLLLHSQGLCYRDISFGNAFFDPDSGDVLIADNDNVSVDGAGVLGVLGTPRFMAPEVVRGEAVPSTQTDLFSLSVLIFYMLMVAHPLEGRKETEIKCLDLPAMTKLYGTEPLFIFDPRDDSNAPVPGIHDNALAFWRIYPQVLTRPLHARLHRGAARPAARARPRERVARRDGRACATRSSTARTARSKTSTTARRSRRAAATPASAGRARPCSGSRRAYASASRSSCSTSTRGSSRTTSTSRDSTTSPRRSPPSPSTLPTPASGV